MLHIKFKFTSFDTLLSPEAEKDENYGLSNVMNVDLFALLYTALYTISLCDHSGVGISKDLFLPILKNGSLSIVRYFKQICASELKRFSVRFYVLSPKLNLTPLSYARKLKSYFKLLYESHLSFNKPLGYITSCVREDISSYNVMEHDFDINDIF